MIVLTNTTAQTLQPGQAITFDEVVLHTGCGECHRRNTASVKMRGCGAYEVAFSGNIGGVAAGPAQLQFSLGNGAILPETIMISTTATAGDLNNVAKTDIISNCCGDYDTISVVNTGTAAITIGAGSSLAIHRLS